MFKNMVVVITGGSSGLGKALAQRFVKKGASVVLVARDRQKLAAAKAQLLASCGDDSKVEIFNCDVVETTARFRHSTAMWLIFLQLKKHLRILSAVWAR